MAGPVEIIAVDNGDPTSFEPFQAAEHDAFHGLALIIVRTKAGQPGAISVRAQSEGLVSGEASVDSAGPLDPAKPTLYVVGDSTAANNNDANAVGWGIPFAAYFDPAKINVLNRARGGRSSRTYVTEGLWDRVRGALRPGDIVLLQMGHNDGGAIADTSRARGSLPGLGDENAGDRQPGHEKSTRSCTPTAGT